jgi:hypothetical protein
VAGAIVAESPKNGLAFEFMAKANRPFAGRSEGFRP